MNLLPVDLQIYISEFLDPKNRIQLLNTISPQKLAPYFNYLIINNFNYYLDLIDYAYSYEDQNLLQILFLAAIKKNKSCQTLSQFGDRISQGSTEIYESFA